MPEQSVLPPWEKEGKSRLAESSALAFGKPVPEKGWSRSKFAGFSDSEPNIKLDREQWPISVSKQTLSMTSCHSLHHNSLLPCVFHLPKCNGKEEEKRLMGSSYSTCTIGGLGAPPTAFSEFSPPFSLTSIVGGRNWPLSSHEPPAYRKSTSPPQFSQPQTATSAPRHSIPSGVLTPELSHLRWPCHFYPLLSSSFMTSLFTVTQTMPPKDPAP